MDTGNLNKPFYPVALPDELMEEIESIREESFTYENLHDSLYDGKYNVVVEFDTRPMKTVAFYKELLAFEQDRTRNDEEGDILRNLLPMIIKKIRVWRVWEEVTKSERVSESLSYVDNSDTTPDTQCFDVYVQEPMTISDE